jgi:hypothetical protein
MTSYHIVCTVTGSYTNPKIAYATEIDTQFYKGKYYQVIKEKHSNPKLNSHNTYCKGCMNDNFIYSTKMVKSNRLVFQIHPDNPLSVFIDMACLGLTAHPTDSYSQENLDFILDSKLHTKWQVVDEASAAGIVNLERRSLTNDSSTKLCVDVVYKRITAFEFAAGDKKMSFKNTYSENSVYPHIVETQMDSNDNSITEKIEVTKALFNLPESYFSFDLVKTGLHTNCDVSYQPAPADMGKSFKAKYWNGSSFTYSLPAKSVSDNNLPSITDNQTSYLPSMAPVQERGFPWRLVLLIFAGVMAVVAVVFGVRGARSRG